MTNELKQEYTLKISQANKTQLIVILYELLLHYVGEAREAFAKEERRECRIAIKRARNCVNELMASLNFDYELAVHFLELYLYVNRELTTADIRFQAESLDHVDKVIKALHEAYESIAGEDESEPVMKNVQTVYAGLTYGKNTLTENLADQGTSRGFRA